MKSQIEVLIHFKKFTNIDLFTQGIYQIRVQIPEAQPYLIFNSIRRDPYTTNEVDKNFVFYEENIEDKYFYSQGFLIRYEDEEMPTNIGCVFRQQETQNIEIVIELLFLDKKLLGDLFVDNLKEVALSIKQQMQIISRATLTVSNTLTYNQAYYPIEFDSAHFCLLETQIHTIPIQFSFTKQQLAAELQTQEKLQELLNQSIYLMLDNRKQLVKQLDSLQNEKKLTQLKYQEKQFDLNDREIDDQIIQSLHDLHHDMYMLWCELVNAIKENHQKLQDQLEQEYLCQMMQRWQNCVFLNKSEVKQLDQALLNGRNNHEQAKQYRSQINSQELDAIKYAELLQPLNANPFIFKHTCLQKGFMQKSQNSLIHYVVLVHGYQGTSYDMRYWKSILTIRFKDKIRLICPTCNDGTSNKPIQEQAQLLANEVSNFINDENVTEFRLSFIGHSLGGLIIRAALPELSEFKQFMHTYVSLGSPHCGYASSESVLVDTGLMMIQKWNKCKTLEELSQRDHKDIKNTYIYTLSKAEGLNWFDNVVLMSSFQDHYVPFHSALIQKIENSNDQRVQAYNETVSNILSKCGKIDRFDINFLITKKKLDKFIGRAAHIEFIDNLILVKMFIYLYDEYFH
ncbi:unnamed protein product (macronuclear) [Paramecium tetraurelia]|uniref:DUF676 domain-containing protein n=1 Tax=Paramecium tetraurelia TaxID=5888 RepID=A0D0K2_PARTE|nr:uncharacterized protein GSPATT00012121001 [Paramecium tetraurelia]CAK76569.1 unnamed protein product [Paramecium tetraurelia]|eukprot:XP_001443966.1 hypothetical protein (macronuclear) [Paramecium tetraurelia strain d4-2]